MMIEMQTSCNDISGMRLIWEGEQEPEDDEEEESGRRTEGDQTGVLCSNVVDMAPSLSFSGASASCLSKHLS